MVYLLSSVIACLKNIFISITNQLFLDETSKPYDATYR